MQDRPYLTLVLVALTIFSYAYMLQIESIEVHTVLAILIHPLLHNSIRHLYSNLLGFFIVGTLIESWMVFLGRKARYLILLGAYVVSTFVTALYYVRTGVFIVGMSGLIFAALPFTIFYYWATMYRKWVDLLDRLAPIGIGFLLSSLIIPLMPNLTDSRIEWPERSAVFHLYAFLPSVLLGGFLYSRVRSKPSRSTY